MQPFLQGVEPHEVIAGLLKVVDDQRIRSSQQIQKNEEINGVQLSPASSLDWLLL